MTRRGSGCRRGAESDDDQALWTKAVRDVKPLRENAEVQPETSVPDPPARSSGPPSPADTPGSAQVRRREITRPTSPPLTGLDRRTRQRLSRGQADYEARLDLHGMGLQEARLALARFLVESVAAGRRLVLVITGKGAAPFARHTLHGTTHFDAPERQGRLRRKLPEWLAEDDLRGYVAGYQPAHPRHGGGGAFYVRIRRGDRSGRYR